MFGLSLSDLSLYGARRLMLKCVPGLPKALRVLTSIVPAMPPSTCEAPFDLKTSTVLDEIRRDVAERHEASGCGEHLAAVEERHDVGQAADEHAVGLAGVAADLDAGDAGQHLGHAVVGQLADVLGHDRVDDEVALLLDLLRRRGGAAHVGHDDVLGHAAHLEQHVDGGRRAGLHLHGVLREVREPAKARLDAVETLLQAGQDVVAVVVGGRAAALVRLGLRGGHDHARDNRSLRVLDGSGERAAAGLAPRRSRQRQERARRDEGEPGRPATTRACSLRHDLNLPRN